MYIKGKWHATVEPAPDSESLAALTGVWDIGIDVKVSNPCEYTSGPVTIKDILIKKENSCIPMLHKQFAS